MMLINLKLLVASIMDKVKKDGAYVMMVKNCKTDGSENIWILNSSTLEEERFVQAYTNKGKLANLNELEWVEGKYMPTAIKKME